MAGAIAHAKWLRHCTTRPRFRMFHFTHKLSVMRSFAAHAVPSLCGESELSAVVSEPGGHTHPVRTEAFMIMYPVCGVYGHVLRASLVPDA